MRVNRVHCRLAPVGKIITMVVALLESDGREDRWDEKAGPLAVDKVWS